MPRFLRGLWLSLVATTTLAHPAVAQYGAKSTEEIARGYNQGVQPIYERIDELRRKANDSSLTMNEAARLVDQQSALRREADQLWSATQGDVTAVYRRTGDAINRYNAETRRLDFESSIVGSQIDLLNNVGKYPSRGQFDQNKDALSQQWEQTYGSRLRPFGDEFAQRKAELFGQVKDRYGVDLEQTGYSRIGTINPYTGETYYKYYGPEGNLVAGQWKDDANGWNKWREDVNTSWRRQRDQQQQLQRESVELGQINNQLEKSRNTVSNSLSLLRSEVRRVEFTGRWSGVLERAVGDERNEGNRTTLFLYSDGTFKGTEYGSGAPSPMTGTWRQSGRVLYTSYNQSWLSGSGRILGDNQLKFDLRNSAKHSLLTYSFSRQH